MAAGARGATYKVVRRLDVRELVELIEYLGQELLTQQLRDGLVGYLKVRVVLIVGCSAVSVDETPMIATHARTHTHAHILMRLTNGCLLSTVQYHLRHPRTNTQELAQTLEQCQALLVVVIKDLRSPSHDCRDRECE